MSHEVQHYADKTVHAEHIHAEGEQSKWVHKALLVLQDSPSSAHGKGVQKIHTHGHENAGAQSHLPKVEIFNGEKPHSKR